MHLLDNWYDVWRLGNFIVSSLCLIWLFGGLHRQQKYWNTKTRDFWYSRLMWAFTGAAISLEGIVYGRELTYTLVLVTAASLVTFKALVKRGTWGYERPPD